MAELVVYIAYFLAKFFKNEIHLFHYKIVRAGRAPFGIR
jgi:hypothetical protein